MPTTIAAALQSPSVRGSVADASRREYMLPTFPRGWPRVSDDDQRGGGPVLSDGRREAVRRRRREELNGQTERVRTFGSRL